MDEALLSEIKEWTNRINGDLGSMQAGTHGTILYELTIAWLLRYKDNPAKQRRMLGLHVDSLDRLFG